MRGAPLFLIASVIFLLAICTSGQRVLGEDNHIRRFLSSIKPEDVTPRVQSGAANWAFLDSLISTTMKCPKRRIPGLAISVTQNGKVVYEKGFGYRDVSRKIPVTPDTQFNVASISKAFTSTLLAMMKDRGLVSWDMPIRNYVPNFKLKDLGTANMICLRDCVCHRTGVGRHDFTWVLGASNTNRTSLAENLHTVSPVLQFRSNFQYNNLMFSLAGHVAERITNTPWEKLVQDYIFSALEMTNTTADHTKVRSFENYAQPYGHDADGNLVPYPKFINEYGVPVGPAASVVSTVKDLSRWLRFHLGDGNTLPDQTTQRTLLSKESLRETHDVQMHMKGVGYVAPPAFPVSFYSNDYAMGWFVAQYRGHQLRYHPGELFGMSGVVGFYPDDNVTVAVSVNTDSVAENWTPLLMAAFDIAKGYEPWFDTSFICSSPPSTDGEEPVINVREMPRFNPGHVREPNMTEFVGNYRSPLYGDLKISHGAASDHLAVSFGDATGILNQALDDIFTITFDNKHLLGSTVGAQFSRSIYGKVSGIGVWFSGATPGPATFTNENYFPIESPYPNWVPIV